MATTTKLSSSSKRSGGSGSGSGSGSSGSRHGRGSSASSSASGSSAHRGPLPALRKAFGAHHFGVSLFWRTFILLSVLLMVGIFAWVLTLRTLDFQPQVAQTAQHITSLVNISRSALRVTDPINRVALMKTIVEQEGVVLRPREPADRAEAYEVDRFTRAVSAEVRARLGAGSAMASALNGKPGVWVAFQIAGEPYWLYTEVHRVEASSASGTSYAWLATALLVTTLGAAGIAGLINRPLQQLSFAASRIREGEYDSRLDEDTATREIREVNRGFNRMARELAKIEEDRAVMLAGISHDLRTPLARMRLEAEMSVVDEEARQHIADDIDQLDAIIDKFMDYARPNEVKLVPVSLAPLVDKVAASVRDPQITIEPRVAPDIKVMTDEIELSRVFANLFENARRYGRSPETGTTRVQVTYAKTGHWIIVNVRDHGPGVPPEKLAQLTTPFYRGDAARTHAQGAGLGLAIVEKSVARMGGQFEVANAPDGGFVAHMRLRRAT